MEIVRLFTIFFYMLSAAGYLAYLFLQKEYLQRGGFILLLAGFACHTAAIGWEFAAQGHMPVRNMRETLSICAWALAGAFLFLQYRYRLKVLGIYAVPLVALIMIVAAQLSSQPVPSSTAFKSFWVISHIIAIFIGEACLALACGAAVLYVIQERSIKNKRRGFFFKRLPSLALLDTAGYACIVVGFTMLTLGLITGFVYAKTVWGRFWSWDPKEVWSGLTWLFYAALLHGRLAVGWRGRRAAVMAIIGFAVCLFTFLGVNFLLKGHHGAFTQW